VINFQQLFPTNIANETIATRVEMAIGAILTQQPSLSADGTNFLPRGISSPSNNTHQSIM